MNSPKNRGNSLYLTKDECGIRMTCLDLTISTLTVKHKVFMHIFVLDQNILATTSPCYLLFNLYDPYPSPFINHWNN